MPSSYTSSLRLTLPATGELTGTWGSSVNDGITTLLDKAVAGSSTITMTAADYTLTTSNGANDEARSMTLVLTGTPGAARNVICPAVSKTYIVYNNTTGGFAQTIKTSAGTGVSVPNGKTKIVRCDGTNVVEGFDAADTLALTGGTASGVLYLNGSKVATSGSALTFDGTNFGVGVTNPANKLVVSNAGAAGFEFDPVNGIMQTYNRSGTAYTGTKIYALNFEIRTGASPAANTFLLDSSGNLGIGTSSPGAKLDVAGLARVGGNATNRGDVVIQQSDNTAAGSGGLEFKADGANSGYGARIKSLFNGVSAYDLGFQLRNNSASWATQMLLDSSGNLGIGTSSPQKKLHIYDSAGAVGGTTIRCESFVGGYGAGLEAGSFTTGAGGVYKSMGKIVWDGETSWTQADPLTQDSYCTIHTTLDGTTAEKLRITSAGNLGIGTSSPGARVDASGQVRALEAGTGSGNGGLIGSTVSADGNAGVLFQTNSASRWNLTTSGTAGANLRIYNYALASTVATLDSSGNLGLGVTPSAWSGVTALQIAASGAIASDNATLDINANAYYNAGYKYIRTQAASRYTQTLGAHQWYTAPSGTAGNAISFTQAMTLDASGNLGVGTTGAVFNAKLDVVGTGSTTVPANLSDLSGSLILVESTKAGTGYGGVGYVDSSGGGAAVVFGRGTGYDTQILFCTNPASTTTSGAMTERARITSGGDLLVGTTSVPSPFTTPAITAFRTGSSHSFVAVGDAHTYDPVISWNKATTGDNRFVAFGTEGTWTERGAIDYNRAGGLVRYNTTSDYRAKDIIGPVQNPGATIDALKVYEGVMKGATQSRPMLIAHEAQAHAPYAVSGVKDEVNEDGTPKFQQMDVSSLVPLLLAEIQSLRTRVAALEAA